MPNKNTLSRFLETASVANLHRAKVTRPHLATEIAERAGPVNAEELVRSLRPHLRRRVLYPQPRR
jgi:hypothetical protein